MATNTHRALYSAFGTPRTHALDEIERAVYVLPTWKLFNPTTNRRVEITNHPAYLTTYLMLLEAGWIDETNYRTNHSKIGNENSNDTAQTGAG